MTDITEGTESKGGLNSRPTTTPRPEHRPAALRPAPVQDLLQDILTKQNAFV